jgi:hypothetical protein
VLLEPPLFVLLRKYAPVFRILRMKPEAVGKDEEISVKPDVVPSAKSV